MEPGLQILSFRGQSRASPRFLSCLAGCLLIVFYGGVACANSGFDFFTLTLGASQSEVTTILSRNAIQFNKTDLETISCHPNEDHKNDFKEAVLTFDRDKLRKIAVYFHIPVTSSNATPVINIFMEQRRSITSQYGAPHEDVEEMKVERIEDRLAWLTRGRAYYRTTWNLGSTARISLWLYGEDSGLVLFKSMESSQK